MSLIIARGRRRDRFGQCLLHFDDLPQEDARALVNSVAAALRGELLAAVGKPDADRHLSTAAAQLRGSHDPGSSVENLTATLVRLLDEEGDLTDELILAAAIEGEMNFVAQALARRSGLSGEIALGELLSGDSNRVIALLRMGRLNRETAAGLLAGVGDLLGVVDPVRSMARFDAMTDVEVADALSWLVADAEYQQAVALLGKTNGQRSF
jgi:hypothetical protein